MSLIRSLTLCGALVAAVAPAFAADQQLPDTITKTTRTERMDAALKDWESRKPEQTVPMPAAPAQAHGKKPHASGSK